MSKAVKVSKAVNADVCPWEDGTLGTSETHAVRSSVEREHAVDESLGLQLISIRLPVSLIEDLKFIAAREGLGYQPLARRVLQRFAANEFKIMAHEALVHSKCQTGAEMDAGTEKDRGDGNVKADLARRRA